MATRSEDAGKLLLRLSVGGLMTLHGIGKLGSGIEKITKMVADAGLPGFVAYGVYIGELVAPLLIILGVLSRVSGAVVAINMVMAIGLAHSADVSKLTGGGGWAIELQLLFLTGGLAITLLGPGRYAVRPGRGWQS